MQNNTIWLVILNIYSQERYFFFLRQIILQISIRNIRVQYFVPFVFSNILYYAGSNHLFWLPNYFEIGHKSTAHQLQIMQNYCRRKNRHQMCAGTLHLKDVFERINFIHVKTFSLNNVLLIDLLTEKKVVCATFSRLYLHSKYIKMIKSKFKQVFILSHFNSCYSISPWFVR